MVLIVVSLKKVSQKNKSSTRACMYTIAPNNDSNICPANQTESRLRLGHLSRETSSLGLLQRDSYPLAFSALWLFLWCGRRQTSRWARYGTFWTCSYDVALAWDIF